MSSLLHVLHVLRALPVGSSDVCDEPEAPDVL